MDKWLSHYAPEDCQAGQQCIAAVTLVAEKLVVQVIESQAIVILEVVYTYLW